MNWTDNSSNEGGFRVQHRSRDASTSPGSWTASVVGADTTSTVVSGLTASETYEFRVTAFMQASDTDSATLSPSGGFTMRIPPAGPTDLSVVMRSGTAVDLKWNDNSAHETGFRVEYRESGASAWNISSTADATTATVSGLRSGTGYIFRILATNANGDSTPSNVASATAMAQSLSIGVCPTARWPRTRLTRRRRRRCRATTGRWHGLWRGRTLRVSRSTRPRAWCRWWRATSRTRWTTTSTTRTR